MSITAWRWIAIGFAATILLLQITTGLESLDKASFSTKASIVLVMVTLAVLPKFIEIAWRSRVRSLAVVLLIAFATWFVYSIPSTIGRIGDARESKAATAASQTAGQKLVFAEWEKAKVRLEEASADVKRLCAKSQVSDNCVNAKATETDRQARYDGLLQEVVGPAVTLGDTGSKMLAWMFSGLAAKLGFTAIDEDVLRKVSVLAYAFGLDIIIWALVWLGTSEKIAARVVSKRPEIVPQETITEREDPITDAEIDELRKLLSRSKRPMSNGDIAQRMGVSKSEASKRVSAAVEAGLVKRERAGREVRVTLH
jgi:DNA-binding transcriptional ArsR family regulator